MTEVLEDDAEYRATSSTQWTTKYETIVPETYSGTVRVSFTIVSGGARLVRDGTSLISRKTVGDKERDVFYADEVDGGADYELQIASPDGSGARITDIKLEYDTVEE